MTEGVFGVHRAVWDHPLLMKDEDEPFSRLEAWLWLISEAAWKPCRVRRGAVIVNLARGQVGHALRHFGKHWRWHESRVRRFLAAMKTDAMIDTATDEGVTIVTICNYDRYQVTGLPTDAATDAASDEAPTQRREEVKKVEEIDGDTRARATPSPTIPPEAHTLADRFLAAVGVDPKNPELSGLAGAPYAAAMWIARGMDHDLILATAADVAARDGPSKPLNYYTKCFETAHRRRDRDGQRQLPLLKTVGGTDESFGRSGPGNHPRSSRGTTHAERAVAAARRAAAASGQGG